METENTNNVCSCCENGSCTPSAVPEGDCDFWKSPQYGYSVRASWTDYVPRKKRVPIPDVETVVSNRNFLCGESINGKLYLAESGKGIWLMENDELKATNVSTGHYSYATICNGTLFFGGNDLLFYLDNQDGLFKKVNGQFSVYWMKHAGNALYLGGYLSGSQVWRLTSETSTIETVPLPNENYYYSINEISEVDGTVYFWGQGVSYRNSNGAMEEILFEGWDEYGSPEIRGIMETGDKTYFYGRGGFWLLDKSRWAALRMGDGDFYSDALFDDTHYLSGEGGLYTWDNERGLQLLSEEGYFDKMLTVGNCLYLLGEHGAFYLGVDRKLRKLTSKQFHHADLWNNVLFLSNDWDSRMNFYYIDTVDNTFGKTSILSGSRNSCMEYNGSLYFTGNGVYKTKTALQYVNQLVATSLTITQHLCGGVLPGYPRQYDVLQYGEEASPLQEYITLTDGELADWNERFLQAVAQKEQLSEVITDNHYLIDRESIALRGTWRNYVGRKQIESPDFLQLVMKLVEDSSGNISIFGGQEVTGDLLFYDYEAIYRISGYSNDIEIIPINDYIQFIVEYHGLVYLIGNGISVLNTRNEIEPTNIQDAYFSKGLVVNDVLYVHQYDKLWFLDTDDKQFKLLTTLPQENLRSIEDTIYTWGWGGISFLDTDGNFKALGAVKDYVYTLDYFDHTIYYRIYGGMYFLNEQGQGQLLFSMSTSQTAVCGNRLYFGGYDGLLFVEKSSREVHRLTSTPCSSLFVAGDLLFFESEGAMYYVNKEGEVGISGLSPGYYWLTTWQGKAYLHNYSALFSVDLDQALNETWKVASELELEKTMDGKIKEGYPKRYKVDAPFANEPAVAKYTDLPLEDLRLRSVELRRYLTELEAAPITMTNAFVKDGGRGELRAYWDGFERLPSADDGMARLLAVPLQAPQPTGNSAEPVMMAATALYVMRHASGDPDPDYERTYSLLNEFIDGGTVYPAQSLTVYLRNSEEQMNVRQQALLRYVSSVEKTLVETENTATQEDKGTFEAVWKTYTPCHKLVVETATTLDTKGFFHCAASLGDSLYLGNYADKGIVRIDTAGNVIPTNKTDGSFYCALPFDGKLYFGGADDIGVWYVDGADGQVKPTNLTEGLFHCMGAWEDTLYFGSFNNTGIWCMDKTEGKVAPTNVTEGYFSCIASDGHTLYFGSHHNKGIWMLDTDTGRIIPTNITTGDWLCAASGRPGQLYLGSGDNRGIVLLTEKGVFEATHLTSGSFQCAGSSGSTLYFGSSNDAGIWKMTSEGLFIATDKTDGSFFSAFTIYGQLFFCSMDHSGVWAIDDTTGVPISTLLSDGNYHCLGANGEVIYGGGYDEQLAALQLRAVTSGELVGTQLEVNNYLDGNLQAGWPRTYSVLDEFSMGGAFYPALSEAAYGQLSKQQQTQRADALLQFLAAQEGGEITVNNNLFIIDFNSIVMRGMIMMWTGTKAPDGWALCDGNNNTPNLCGRFVVGYDASQGSNGDYGAIDKKGGAAKVVLAGKEMPKHRHFAQRVNGDDGANKNYYYCSNMQNAGDRSLTSADGMTVPSGAGGQTGISGNGEAHENRPPYYVLAYIMKL